MTRTTFQNEDPQVIEYRNNKLDRHEYGPRSRCWSCVYVNPNSREVVSMSICRRSASGSFSVEAHAAGLTIQDSAKGLDIFGAVALLDKAMAELQARVRASLGAIEEVRA